MAYAWASSYPIAWPLHSPIPGGAIALPGGATAPPPRTPPNGASDARRRRHSEGPGVHTTSIGPLGPIHAP
eukprot:14009595-Alexandrium_andersonii.AAC.1